MSALAIDGGPRTVQTPFPRWPVVADDEIAAVEAVLRSNTLNYWGGTEVRDFETEWADAHGVPHAIAVANGTLSLELLLRAHGIGPGDDVIVTPRSFMASVSAPVALGARPVFADVDRDTQNLSASTIEAALTPATRAILVVHLAGRPAEMTPILDLAAAHDLVVIEDCAQAHGARYRGTPVGALGHGGSWSFCQDKILTTGGEGGMVTLRDEALWRKAWAYKDHGKSYEAVYEREHPPGYRWLIESFGSNYRMTEMQGAIGRVILQKLPAWVARRRRNASLLLGRLASQPALRVPPVPEYIEHAWYKAYAFVNEDALREGWSRDRLAAAISAEGVVAMQGSCSELYREKAVPPALQPAERLPVARELGETSLMMLVHPTLEDEHMHRYADAVEKVLRVATR